MKRISSGRASSTEPVPRYPPVQVFYSSVHGLLRPANDDESAHQVNAPLKQKRPSSSLKIRLVETLGGSIQ